MDIPNGDGLQNPGRRRFLGDVVRASLSVSAFLALPGATAFAATSHHRLRMYCPDTDERFDEIMIADRQWTPGALAAFSRFARDWHVGRYKEFDPRVVLSVMQLQFLMNSPDPLYLNSGYRTEKTNRNTQGAVKNSYHVKARAMDLRQPGRTTSQLYRAALSLEPGGVGYYPRKRFVHIDSGKFRKWTR